MIIGEHLDRFSFFFFKVAKIATQQGHNLHQWFHHGREPNISLNWENPKFVIFEHGNPQFCIICIKKVLEIIELSLQNCADIPCIHSMLHFKFRTQVGNQQYVAL